MIRLPIIVAAFIITGPVLGATGGGVPGSSGSAAGGSSAHAGGGGAGGSAHGGVGGSSAHAAAASTHGAAASAHIAAAHTPGAAGKHVEALNSSQAAALMEHHRHPYRYPAFREPQFATPYMGACMPDPNGRIAQFWAPCATPNKTRPKAHG